MENFLEWLTRQFGGDEEKAVTHIRDKVLKQRWKQEKLFNENIIETGVKTLYEKESDSYEGQMNLFD